MPVAGADDGDGLTWPSPNFGERRGGVHPSIIVIHYTAMQTCSAARQRLCDPDAEVSAHWLISERGEAEALVPEAARAWHAGAGEWAGITDVNSHSIGIELANRGNHPFPEPQMVALEAVLRGLMTRWHIPAHRVIGHSDMAPARKGDPGPRFDWRRLARLGLSIWPDPAGQMNGAGQVDGAAFRALAASAGYGMAAPDEVLLAAVRLRFRPWATGRLDAQDMAVVQQLARLSVDAGGAQA
jgi:N-acetylmuramoyl-L-alanine amidase